MEILGFPVGPLQANAYLAICESTSRCALVDPGGEAGRLLETVDERGIEVEAILLTHAHLDHVGGVAEAAKSTGAPIYLHPADRPLYDAAPEQARSFGLQVATPPPPDHELADGEEIRIGVARLQVRHTPGHSPGHVCLIGEGFALVGDCVFAGSIGPRRRHEDAPGLNQG
jgi:glyoxylase-like metal-dependent hydrolase (beta-lactamase superfamily II)